MDGLTGPSQPSLEPVYSLREENGAGGDLGPRTVPEDRWLAVSTLAEMCIHFMRTSPTFMSRRGARFLFARGIAQKGIIMDEFVRKESCEKAQTKIASEKMLSDIADTACYFAELLSPAVEDGKLGPGEAAQVVAIMTELKALRYFTAHTMKGIFRDTEKLN